MKSILVLARKYPPSVGGMEIYSKNLVDRLSQHYDVDKIVMGRSQVNLAWFLPFMVIKAFLLARKKQYDLVYLCDSLLAPFGFLLKKALNVKVFVTAHGLDITYNKFFYQHIVPPAVKALDKVICVSRNTMDECVKRGIGREKCVFIANGIEPRIGAGKVNGEGAATDKKVIVTVGRLIKRKGVSWFIENIMPKIKDDCVYMVLGDGPEKHNIEKTIKRTGLEQNVLLLGRVSDQKLNETYRMAHAMVMPNQLISDDPEGFGIVAIEAASYGVPVIANNIDGLSDAVINGKTGWLVKYNDAGMFIDKIRDTTLSRDAIKTAAAVFGWDNVIKKYNEVIDVF